MDIQYLGETLWPGRLGHALLILSFVASLVALIAVIASTTSSREIESSRWRKLASRSFIIHAVSIIGVITLLYFLIFNGMYEYDYVRRHSNAEMGLAYKVSCFWAGQQGSFLVWIFWQAVVGSLLIFFTQKKWLAPVIGVFALLQLILSSMLLGIYIPRWPVWLVMAIALQLPLVFAFRQNGLDGWKAIIPGYNFAGVRKVGGILPHIMALPILFLLIQAVANIASDGFTWMTETVKVGVSPFALAREEFSDNAIFLFPNYLERIVGLGLNPLLENPWMVIHPPTLFFGFSLTLVPFAFAISGLVQKEYKNWVKPALPWTVVAGMVLGIGILMGGMWAYESLSFGGFWAWDPVENASLVPWLTLIAGMHTLLIYKHSGHALKATLIFFTVSVFLVLYSTFLTRSGILGDSSVHSFTDLGMMGQLLLLILGMMYPAILVLAQHWKKMPSPKKEESAYSREFWMFIGSLVLGISALHITLSTSLPVYNKIATGINELLPFLNLKDNFALPNDVVGFYNDVQVWIAILIALLTAAAQYLKYRKTTLRTYIWKVAPPLLLSLIITALLEALYHFSTIGHMLLLFAGIFAALINFQYIWDVLKGRLNVSGSAIAHIGFGLVMIGIVIALSKSSVISKNYQQLDFGSGFDQEFKQNNLYLLQGEIYFMEDYQVTFQERQHDKRDYYFTIDYKRVDPESGEVQEDFQLEPHLLNHPDMGIVANPSTKRYLHRDIFTHITALPMNQNKEPMEMPMSSIERVAIGDSFFTSRGLVKLENIQQVDEEDDRISVVANLRLDRPGQEAIYAQPVFTIEDNQIKSEPEAIDALNISFEIQSIDPEKGQFVIRVIDNNDWIIMKAIVFPWINILWLGIIVTMIGFMITMFHRIKEYNRTKKREAA